MAREQRRLAAIVAADVVGYSRLMGRDESGTLARLQALRSELIDPRIAENGGRIVKTTGDGLLLEFPSVVDAVRCALEVQQRMGERNTDVPYDSRITFRIGINLGDIIIDGDDIHGDGVNVAARLEAEAPAGGIVLAGAVHDAVSGRVQATFEDLGELSLKNIERAVRAYRARMDGVSAAHVAGPAPVGAPLALPDKPSIAALPFQNMSGDPEQEYFADGVVEDIITALSRFRSLFVIARNSSFTYKGRAVDVKQVGRELGVRYVLEGSVRKAAGRLRVTAQLIDTTSGAHIWADRLDGALEDVFDLQDRITEQVVTAIAPRIEAAEIARSRQKVSGNLDAYDCYLRGMACLNPISRSGIVNALRLFRQAIELDPAFPGPYAMALNCYANRRGWGLVEDPVKERADVEALVHRALQVGRDDALTLSNAAWVVSIALHNLQSAKRLIDQALELNSNLSSAWAISGWVNIWLGDPQTAVEHLTRGMRLDPHQTLVTGGLRPAMAHACYFLGRHDEALSWAEHMLQLHPEAHPALRIAAASAAFAGKVEVAQRFAERLSRVDPAFRVSRLAEYLAQYQNPGFVEKYAEGLRRAGLPE